MCTFPSSSCLAHTLFTYLGWWRHDINVPSPRPERNFVVLNSWVSRGVVMKPILHLYYLFSYNQYYRHGGRLLSLHLTPALPTASSACELNCCSPKQRPKIRDNHITSNPTVSIKRAINHNSTHRVYTNAQNSALCSHYFWRTSAVNCDYLSKLAGVCN